MLIKIFGIWLMASNINFLIKEGDKNCEIVYGFGGYYGFKKGLGLPYACDIVAAEINKQIKASKE